MYVIVFENETLHRYSGGDLPPRWGWGPNDWQDAPTVVEMQFDLHEEAQQCLNKIGAMGAGASIVQVERDREYVASKSGAQ